MADIKTKDNAKGTIRTIDKAAVATQRMKQAYFNEIWNDKKVLQEVTDEVVESITAAYNENSPDFIYFVTLYNIFNEFLEDVSEDVLPNPRCRSLCVNGLCELQRHDRRAICVGLAPQRNAGAQADQVRAGEYLLRGIEGRDR